MMIYIEKQIERLCEEKYHSVESEGFHTDAARLKNGEPFEYVLGYANFLGAKIDLSHKPILPVYFLVKYAKPKPLRQSGHPPYPARNDQ